MSISTITYLSQFVIFEFYAFTNAQFAWFYFSDIIEIKLFLKNLELGKCYVLTLELFVSDTNDDTPVITLCDPILVTSNSNSTLISKFINNQLIQADNNFNLDYDLLINMRNAGKTVPYIIVKYNYIFASINWLNNYDDGPIRLIQLICLATFIIIVLANINLLMIRIFIL